MTGTPPYGVNSHEIYGYGVAKAILAIVAHDLTTGRERELCPGGIGYGKLAFSPDGGTLAFMDGQEHKKTCIKAVPAAGDTVGESRSTFLPSNIDIYNGT